MNPAEPSAADPPDACLGQPAVRELTQSPDSPVMASLKRDRNPSSGGRIKYQQPRLNYLNAAVH